MQRDDPTLQAYGALAVLSGYEGRCEAADQGVTFEAYGDRAIASPARVRRLCLAQAAWRPLQYVFYGAGALVAGAGAYFLLARDPGFSKTKGGGASAGHVWVLPGIGPAPLGGSVGGIF
jgi:hypothetical protein